MGIWDNDENDDWSSTRSVRRVQDQQVEERRRRNDARRADANTEYLADIATDGGGE